MSVSDGFKKFEQKRKGAFKKAQEAENTARGIPLPIGTQGDCVSVEMKCGTTTKKSTPFINLIVLTTSPADKKDKRCQKTWFISDSEGASDTDRWEWMLNDLENAGLPREIRTEYKDFEKEVVGYFNNNKVRMNYRVVEDQYAQDNVNINLYAADNLGESENKEEKQEEQEEKEEKTETSSETESPKEEDTPENEEGYEVVTHLGIDYYLIGEGDAEGTVKIKSMKSGRVKEVSEDKIKEKE